jgi:ribosome modulation factor
MTAAYLRYWSEGHDAFLNGDAVSSCPYHFKTQKHSNWVDGWTSAEYSNQDPSWHCDFCQVTVRGFRCQHCGKSHAESR